MLAIAIPPSGIAIFGPLKSKGLVNVRAHALLAQLERIPGLTADLRYDTSMRFMACVRLSIQAIDFEYRQLVVRNAKGVSN